MGVVIELSELTPADLLREARAAGLEVCAEGDRLVVRGPRAAASLAQALVGRKAEVLPLLASQADATVRPSWDPVEAERLLAELRAEVARLEKQEFRGKPPPLFTTLAADLVAIGEGYVRHHDIEAARGWDALELLRGLKPLLPQIAARAKAMVRRGQGP